MIHILHVIDSLSVGGAERMLVEIANRTVEKGDQASVCITRSGSALREALRPEIFCLILNRQRRFEYAAIKKLVRYVNEKRVNVLHVHSRTTMAFVAVVKSLNLLHVPIVFHDHYGSIETDKSIPIWMRFWAKYWVSHYVGVYSKLGEWAKAAGINPRRISVIENALDLNRYLEAEPIDIRQEFNIPGNVPVGIVIGGLRREKGIDVLLEALSQSAYSHAAKILVVGGERDQAYVRNCQTQMAALGLNNNVIFAGSRLDVPSLLAGADFGIIASRSESGPLVLIEFLASGLPFVSTLVGGIANQVSELGVPEFVDSEDSLGLAKAIDRLLSLSASERRERGKRGQEIARLHFDINLQMSRWYKIYTAVLGGIN